MILALLGAIFIGLALGLLGSGGSILTVPVLIYLAHEPARLAVAESLAIVGCISLVGALPYARQGKLAWPMIVLFGLPGMLGTYLGAALSEHLSTATQLCLFAVVMLAAATFMFRPAPKASQAPKVPSALTALQGLGVGVLTGLVGVGGGFLIVPALVLLSGLPMGLAVGTSLAIITLNSAVGFVKHLYLLQAAGVGLHWPLMALVAAIGIAGSLLGARLGRQVKQENLRRAFAAFLVLMGLVVMGSNVGGLLH